MQYVTYKNVLKACSIAGFGLFITRFFMSGDIMGFFALLALLILATVRNRIPKTQYTSLLDVVIVLLLYPQAIALAMLAAMYHKMYIAIAGAIYVTVAVDFYFGVFGIMAAIIGLVISLWAGAEENRLTSRDTDAGRYYQLESMQASLLSATAQIEHMTTIAERARISRDLHDNAGHDIIASFISMQTIRPLFDDIDPDLTEMYDSALARLDVGVKKMREAIHNMAPVVAMGVERIEDICKKHPQKINFTSHGNMADIPVHVLQAFETCVKESLTNITKHAVPDTITVDISVTPKIARLLIENDGSSTKKSPGGAGLRNLNYRIKAIGGTFAATADRGKFRTVCVVPLNKELHS